MKRREFLQRSAAIAGIAPLASRLHAATGMQLGLVTYQWGKDMDLATVIRTCEQSGLSGVELRTEHAHKVEPNLTKAQRSDVKKRFADSPVTLVGYGANSEYHSPDPAILKKNIEETKAYVQLMADCGGSGVKVKPNTLPAGVPREKTIEQIGKALNEVGAYAADYGQKIRVEVHGRYTQDPPVMKEIFDVATHPNVYICWNCNDEDLKGAGLAANFNMLKGRFGDTVHIRELDQGTYPYGQLLGMFKAMNYNGWFLLEARTEPADKVKAMAHQLEIFKKMTAS